VRFQNAFNKVAIELRFVQFWSEIILVIPNRTRAARSFDFEIMRMISDQIALHSGQLPLLIITLWLNDRQPVKVLKSVNDRQSDIFLEF